MKKSRRLDISGLRRDTGLTVKTIKRVAVFCGSSPGADHEYLRVADELGQALVSQHIGLVYGGASVGLMGQNARAVLSDGGEVIGVIPDFLVEREGAFKEFLGRCVWKLSQMSGIPPTDCTALLTARRLSAQRPGRKIKLID